MKDITGDVIKSMTPDEINRRKSLSVRGVETKMSDDIFMSFLNQFHYYEPDNITDLIENYSKLSELSRIPKEILKSSSSAFFKSRDTYKEFNKLFKQYGDIYTRYTQSKPSLLNILRGRMENFNVVYLSDVMLDNFESIITPLISLYKFDIIDRRGVKIQGIMVYDSLLQSVMDVSEERFIEKRESVERARNAMRGSSYVVQGFVMNEKYRDHQLKKQTRPKCLSVIRIQDGGSGRKMDPPTIRV